METKKLIKFIKHMMKDAKKDMKQCEKYGMYEDVAYAEGAYNAYEVMLNKLESNNE
jgi:pantothenate kinase